MISYDEMLVYLFRGLLLVTVPRHWRMFLAYSDPFEKYRALLFECPGVVFALWERCSLGRGDD
jgi:hypothetical protein